MRVVQDTNTSIVCHVDLFEINQCFNIA